MKKLTSFLLAILVFAVVSISFTSCGDPEEPDDPNVPNISEETIAGVYNPGRRISKVYYQEGENTEYLSQEWTWSKNKITSISYFDEDGLRGEEKYTYAGNKVIQVTDHDGYYSKFYYTDKHFDKIEYYDPSNFLVSEYTFQYEGNKISLITYHGYQWEKNVANMIERMMSKLLPEEVMRMFIEKIVDSPESSLDINFLYEGENLSLIAVSNLSYIYADYDTKSNIWFNYYPCSTIEQAIDTRVFSKNNPGKLTMENGSFNIEYTYTYSYIGDYQVITCMSTNHGSSNYSTTTRIVYQ